MQCLKVAGAKVLLVDEDAECRARIEEVRSRVEGELGMHIHVLDAALKGEIQRMEPVRPVDELRVNAKGSFPLFLFYTRSDGRASCLQLQLTSIVAQPVILKLVLC